MGEDVSAVIINPATNNILQPRRLLRGVQRRRRPRLGFLGVGWIGRNRMEAIINADVAEVTIVAEPNKELSAEALKLAPRAEAVASLDELLEAELDGVVIATPSALHAEQAL